MTNCFKDTLVRKLTDKRSSAYKILVSRRFVVAWGYSDALPNLALDSCTYWDIIAFSQQCEWQKIDQWHLVNYRFEQLNLMQYQ